MNIGDKTLFGILSMPIAEKTASNFGSLNIPIKKGETEIEKKISEHNATVVGNNKTVAMYFAGLGLKFGRQGGFENKAVSSGTNPEEGSLSLVMVLPRTEGTSFGYESEAQIFKENAQEGLGAIIVPLDPKKI